VPDVILLHKTLMMTTTTTVARAIVLATATVICSVEAFAPYPLVTRRYSVSTTQQRPSAVAVGPLASFFGNWFESKTTKTIAKQPVYETVVIDPDFRVAGLFLGLGVALDCIPYLQLTLGPLVTALGALFVFQAFRIRFVFDEENNFELKTTAPLSSSDEELRDSGENVVVGGANKWACDTIVNYDFFPQSWMADPKHPIGPILVYFKETQTDSSSWSEGPGQAANDPAKIASGQAVAGQVHFFPAVGNARQIEAEFAKRGCGKI
jgi:Protein of unknown function (DUF3119)